MADHSNYQVAMYIQIEVIWEMKINKKKEKRKESRKRMKLTKSIHIVNQLSNAFSFRESITIKL